MRQEVRDYLIVEYNKLELKSRFTALKFHFKHKNVNVNIYFDAYDDRVPSMCMILAYERKYYYTSLNIRNTGVQVEYLEKIPSVILKQIVDESNHLNAFFADIEDHILNDDKIVINYKRDVYFINTMKYSRLRKDLPFIHFLKKVKMGKNTLKQLSQTLGVEIEILKKIQSAGFTIVRTEDINKRKSLTAIIENCEISI